MEETPEKTWDSLKLKLYPKGTPEKTEMLIQEAFKASTSESEKWEHLANFMKTIKNKFD